MKCGSEKCTRPATHYISWIIGEPDETLHVDCYGCDDHTEMAENDAARYDRTIEFEATELPK